MPRLTIDDLKRLATAQTIKGQRYREAAQMLPSKSEEAFTLREEARRCEAIANALQGASAVSVLRKHSRFDAEV